MIGKRHLYMDCRLRERIFDMVIQLPEWEGWRVAGSDNDWQVQVIRHRKSGDTWEGTNFFSTLGCALAFAYEKALRESKSTAKTVKEMKAECTRVKDGLMKEVAK